MASNRKCHQLSYLSSHWDDSGQDSLKQWQWWIIIGCLFRIHGQEMPKELESNSCRVSREVSPWHCREGLQWPWGESHGFAWHSMTIWYGHAWAIILRSTVCQGAHGSSAKHLADALLWQHISVSYVSDPAMKCQTKWPIQFLHHLNLLPVGSYWNTRRGCEVILGFQSMSSQVFQSEDELASLLYHGDLSILQSTEHNEYTKMEPKITTSSDRPCENRCYPSAPPKALGARASNPRPTCQCPALPPAPQLFQSAKVGRRCETKFGRSIVQPVHWDKRGVV